MGTLMKGQKTDRQLIALLTLIIISYAGHVRKVQRKWEV